jgi:aminopeptidase N
MKRALLTILFCAEVSGFAFEHVQCGRNHAWLAPTDSSAHRKYAPDREFDLLHLALDVTPDFKTRSVAGQATIHFKPNAKPLEQLRLDAVELAVETVTSSEKIAAYQATDKEVIVTFTEAVPANKEATVTVKYSATPRRGLYFRTPEMGYKASDMHIWTQGEPHEARHWYPCFDSPNEKFTSEITCRVPSDMVVLSNGKRMSEEKQAGSPLVAVRWLQDKPHVNYLICLVAGYFKNVEDKHRDISLAFYTTPSEIEQAKYSFEGTKDMMEFFEKEIGVPYPWAKYDQVCVGDFGWGGMENTTLTTLNERTLHTPEFETLRSSQGLVAHELAHQWFGDLVTCKDWANLWLNEGFASYYDLLYDEHKNGRDWFIYDLYSSAKGIIGQADQTNAAVRRDYNEPEQQFGYQVYPKGAWVLHMLRSQLGKELYRQCIKTYVERHQYGTVVTEDLNAVVQQLSGRSFDQFFDQWIYHASQPDLAVSYSWDDKAKLAKVTIEQKQKLSEDVLLFNFPLAIRFKTKSASVDRQITVKEKAEDFYFPLTEAPEFLRIDPELTVLAKITFSPTMSMLYAQLADKSDMLGRLIAAEQLGSKKERSAVAKLKDVLNNDSFYGVRMAASKALQAINSEEAYEALLAAARQPDARARRQVLSDIGKFYRERTYEHALKMAKDEKNPDLRAQALELAAAYPKPETGELLRKSLVSESYKNVIADGAVDGMRATGDAKHVEPLLAALKEREDQFTSSGFARGLDAVAYLARHQEDKTAVREFLVSNVNHKKQRVQLGVLAALGTLNDPKAISVLEPFAASTVESPERSAAEKSLKALRDNRPASAELGSVRTEVLNLQKENRELRKELDDLKKRLDAVANPPVAPKGKTPSKRAVR